MAKRITIQYGEHRLIVSINEDTTYSEIKRTIESHWQFVLAQSYQFQYYSPRIKQMVILTESYNFDDIPDCSSVYLVEEGQLSIENVSPLFRYDPMLLDFDEIDEALEMPNGPNTNQEVFQNNLSHSNFRQAPQEVDMQEEFNEYQTSSENSDIFKRDNFPNNPHLLPANTNLSVAIVNPRLRFVRDVNRHQKDNYLSNAFRVSKTVPHYNHTYNAQKGISFIQGKKPPKCRKSTPPIITGLQKYADLSGINLRIYSVTEDITNDDNFIWRLSQNKGFLLRNELRPNAKSKNPISISLNNSDLLSNDEFELRLYMLTEWNRKPTETIVYQMNKLQAAQLCLECCPKSSRKSHMLPVRLLVVLERNNIPDWATFCLSNFIISSQ